MKQNRMSNVAVVDSTGMHSGPYNTPIGGREPQVEKQRDKVANVSNR